jgi:methylmalonyl-CoA mutase
MTASVSLAGGFAAVAEADWRTAVSRSGQSPDHGLVATSDDGIPVGPIHQRRVGVSPVAMRAPGQPWQIIQRVSARTVTAAVSMCRGELAGGADGVALGFAEAIHPLPGSLPADMAPGMAAGLAPVLAEGASLVIEGGARTPGIAAAFLEVAAKRKLDLRLAFDLVAAVATGHLPAADTAATAATLAGLAETFDGRDIAGTVVLADGRIWHAAGASEAQELAAVLATVIAHLRLFEGHGYAPDRAASRVGVALAADTDQFLTIAKLRAMRLLLAYALEATGIVRTIPIHAETAWRVMSRREPRMNVLRATGAAFAAAVGGADSITVLPFDALEDGGSEPARRLARNTQLVIAQESQLFRFADPAAGSGAVEALTDALAEKAWDRFRAIEAAGGMLAALEAGTLQRDVAATRDARLARVLDGTMGMVGVNTFVATGDAPVAAATKRTDTAENVLVFRRLAEAAEVPS